MDKNYVQENYRRYLDNFQDIQRDTYSRFEGATIVEFLGMEDIGGVDLIQSFPVFVMKLKTGSIVHVAISADSEMNSGGQMIIIGGNVPDAPVIID